MIKRLIDLAVIEAEKSTHVHKVGAIIFCKNEVISTGYNRPLSQRRKLHPKFRKWPTSVHAEADAIISARANLRGCDILVVRINNSGEFRFARPCDHCMSYLKHTGIRKIFYTTNDSIAEEKI